MKKKSQIAIEQIAIYSFAILMVGVSVGALYYFGFSSDKQKPQFCSISNGFICTDFVIEETQLQVVAKNVKGVQIEITGYAAAGCAQTADSINLAPDASTTITITSCVNSNYYDGDVNISYTNSESGLAHTAHGEIKGAIGR